MTSRASPIPSETHSACAASRAARSCSPAPEARATTAVVPYVRKLKIVKAPARTVPASPSAASCGRPRCPDDRRVDEDVKRLRRQRPESRQREADDLAVVWRTEAAHGARTIVPSAALMHRGRRRLSSSHLTIAGRVDRHGRGRADPFHGGIPLGGGGGDRLDAVTRAAGLTGPTTRGGRSRPSTSRSCASRTSSRSSSPRRRSARARSPTAGRSAGLTVRSAFAAGIPP